MSPSPQWFCAQIGAREHYAVPRVLHQSGRLAALYTDFWAGPVTRGIWEQSRKLKLENRNAKASGALRSLAARYHPDLETAESRKQKIETGKKFPLSTFPISAFKNVRVVRSWNLRSLWWEMVRKAESRKQKIETGDLNLEGTNKFQLSDSSVSAFNRQPSTQPPSFQLSALPISAFSPYHGFIEVGRRFATCVRAELKRRKNLPPGMIFYAYDTGALEAFEWCQQRGIKCILNQMDPNRVEVNLVRAEEKQWPGWALQAMAVPEQYFVRREQEWALADRIVVNSEFSRQALLQQGVPAEKLVVIPLCFEAKAESRKQKTEAGDQKSADSNKSQLSAFQISASSPLRVLFLGQVILRKGIQYLLAAAKQLEKANLHFDIVGPVGISADAIATAPKNVTFHGRTGRDQAANWYRQSHVFVLPTLSDGFAITQLEAMAHGLPVVTTPCCGEVVSDGVDGFVVPARDAEALVRTFQRYLNEPELLPRQSAAALVKAQQFTPERLAENLRKLEADLEKQKAESRNREI